MRDQRHVTGHLGRMPDMVSDFVLAGSVDELDTTCAAEFPFVPFALE